MELEDVEEEEVVVLVEEEVALPLPVPVPVPVLVCQKGILQRLNFHFTLCLKDGKFE
jgi:hypothetical protein